MKHHVHVAYFFPAYIFFNLFVFMIIKGVVAYREANKSRRPFIECYIDELRTIRVRDLILVSIFPP